MQKPVLVIMAAGMGSRYGGLKQIDPVGPGGQIILDYSIYDAHRVGFERVVFIIWRRRRAGKSRSARRTRSGARRSWPAAARSRSLTRMIFMGRTRFVRFMPISRRRRTTKNTATAWSVIGWRIR